jgi:CheY-like chemotaxis protein
MDLLNSVLDFARYEDGEIPVDAVDLDILEVVDDVAAMVSEQARRKGLELVATCDPTLPRGLRGDPTKLRQVLLNLASNAVKFTASGEVVIRVGVDSWTPEGPLVRFAVSDTGAGLDPADQERMFTAFTQGDAAATGPGGGTGLGLAIVRSLATAMGGRAGVRSTPGEGSTFWARVPLALAARSRPIVTRPSRARPGLRVLVVDDNASSRRALAEQLAAWELDVDQAESGGQALELLDTARAEGRAHALVVTDLGMPGLDGLELSAAVRAHCGDDRPSVVLLSAGATLPSDRLREAGVDVVLPKPVQVSRLHGAVQRALGAGIDPPSELTLTPTAVTGRGVVLVVEDSEVNRMVAVGTLRQLGYLTETAGDGAQAVERASEHNYDAILMDCRMPVMDGYEATRELRAREASRGTHRVPIIAVTANVVAGDRQRCLDAGMDDYLVKPLGRKVLGETLARWVVQGEPTSV